jgi:S1-C subfamily serine protease
MDSHEHENPAAVAAATARRDRTCRLRTGATAFLLVGAAFAVHGAATSHSPSTAVLSRPEWSGAAGGWSRSDSPVGWAGAGASTSQVATATDAQQTGVVDIDVILNGTQRAAGTGMVLTANGEVLTNRHVVSGETAIAVTIPATGRTYDAHVVGIASNTDVAVVQLEGASGLDTVKTASGTVSLGDEVVGVGNAGGTGGTPSAAPGQVTGLGSSITATDEDGSNPEDLTGLIQTDADIEPGDSGGPLLNTSNAVVGMDTAGSSEGGDGYAIPIATALGAAKQIEANPSGSAQSGSGENGSGQSGSGQNGQSGSGQSQAPAGSAYLGVEVQDGPTGAEVVGVVDGSPAAQAGLTAGDTLTSVAGQRIGSVADLASVMAQLAPGQAVDVTFAGPDGSMQSSSITLAAAPTA